MFRYPMECKEFETLLSRINQETTSDEHKLAILYQSKGNFSANQGARLLYAFANHPDKLRCMRIIETRMCHMSCSEARDMISAISIHNDKLQVLAALKRYLTDSQSRDGTELILSSFCYPEDKEKAISILRTVRSDIFDQTPSGGHQLYAALGGLYTQARPMLPHMYGPEEVQRMSMPGHGKTHIPVTAKAPLYPSRYTGHPSYAYPTGEDYSSDRAYPGNVAQDPASFYPNAHGECPAKPPLYNVYPSGAPPLGYHHGGPAPCGFQNI